ncbi:peroxiredoxin-like family protein [Carboxylicivirga sp. N1Y90]|uniref:peroxiredoxin-like family protein n=1 Tax=Carboxylicivirga fragile TaxID=3417571 RepID=UPI003D337115|nr:AhpC/TSA family protein [Marinilabiliaceae bacterium N1Y90]
MKTIQLITILALFSINAIGQEKRSAKDAVGLQVGDAVKNFSAKDMNGDMYELKEELKKGPIVVIFYRGQWCPVCNRHLNTLQENLQLIYDKGASVIAISPEKPEYLKISAEKTKASFSLLYDEAYVISDIFDVTFSPDAFTKASYNTVLGANLKNAHSDESQRLPIPATFIIGQDEKIIWRHFDPNYKERSTVEDIVSNIK